MTDSVFVTKGTRLRFRVFHARPLGYVSLAGVQTKTSGQFVEREGVVTHVRGDHPTHPTSIRLWLRLGDGTEVGPIDPAIVVAVIPQRADSDRSTP